MIVLDHDQRLLLQTIYDRFRQDSRWPSYYAVGRELADMDVTAVAQSLPPNLIDSQYAWWAYQEPTDDNRRDASLSVRAIQQCRGSDRDVRDFVGAVQYCVSRLFTRGAGLQVTNRDFDTLFDGDPARTQRVYLMMSFEADLLGSGTTQADGVQWSRLVASSSRTYREVESIGRYLALRETHRGEEVVLNADLLAILRYLNSAYEDARYESAARLTELDQADWLQIEVKAPGEGQAPKELYCNPEDITELVDLGYVLPGRPGTNLYRINERGRMLLKGASTQPGSLTEGRGAMQHTKSGDGRATIFIGHGRDPQWRDLADFLRTDDRYSVISYESGARAGYSTVEVLAKMMDQADMGFLVHTGEDEVEGGQRARENVVHEAGLFQGRLGFRRAIILLEEGCSEYSNIKGLSQIRFKKGQIGTKFGEILQTILREFPGK